MYVRSKEMMHPVTMRNLPDTKPVEEEGVFDDQSAWNRDRAAARRAFWKSLKKGNRVTVEDAREMMTLRSRWRFYSGNTYGHNGSFKLHDGRRCRVTWPVYAWRKQQDGTYYCWVISDVQWTPVDLPSDPVE